MQPPLYLADEAFDMLVVRVPNELIRGFDLADFDAAIGMNKEQYAALIASLEADGRTSGWADPQLAGTLRNGLAAVLFELGSEFSTRVGYSQEDATELLTQLNTWLRKANGEAQS